MKTLVTGAAGGIGTQIVRRLRSKRELIAVDRDRDALNQLPNDVDTRAVDLTDEQAIQEELSDEQVETLISAVGWYELAAIEDCSPSSFEKHLATNLTAVHTPIYATLPTIRKHSGNIVILGSVVGRVSLPYHGGYSASKAGLAGYTDTLRREVASKGVDVSLIEPGPIRTGFNERATSSLNNMSVSVYAEDYHHFRSYSPTSVSVDTVVDYIIAAIEADRPKARYRIGRRARWLPWLQTILPTRVFDRVVRSGLPGGLLHKLIDR